jgi:triphosphoribosyl-dephospho-CoA synthase
MEQAPFHPIGQTILDCIRATRRVTNANTNLGIVLLLAPLASVPPNIDLKGGLIRSLIRTSVDDAKSTYEAIRLAMPGGLGSVAAQDVANEPSVTLRETMALAADRDTIAKQYVNDFEQVFEGVEILREEMTPNRASLNRAITQLFLRLLAKYPDSLIARKKGREFAEQVSRNAKQALKTGAEQLGTLEYLLFMTGAGGFDNPGTTADLIAACLFVAFRTGMIELPLDRPFFTTSVEF